MRIKKTISEKSNLDLNTLMERSNSKIMEQGYAIINKTPTTICFSDDNWQFRSRNKIFSRVDKGVITLTTLQNGILLEYVYYISCLPEIIILSILSIIAIITQEYLIVLISAPLVIQLLLRIVTLYKVNKEIVLTIIGQDAI